MHTGIGDVDEMVVVDAGKADEEEGIPVNVKESGTVTLLPSVSFSSLRRHYVMAPTVTNPGVVEGSSTITFYQLITDKTLGRLTIVTRSPGLRLFRSRPG